MKYKMVVSDFDGTLSYSTDTVVNYISKANVDAINSFISRGGTFIVCTGRATTGIVKILKAVNYKGYFATYNGAVIGDLVTGKIFKRTPISNELVLKFIKLAEKFNVNIHTYPNDVLCIKKETEYTKWYTSLNCDLEVNVIPNLYEYFKENGFDSAKLILNDNPLVLDKYINEFIKTFPECNVVRATSHLVEINMANVSKGEAVKTLCDVCNVKIEETIAVGDAGNDISMIQQAGLGVAMGNASDVVKKSAGYVARDVKDDAIKYLIEELCI